MNRLTELVNDLKSGEINNPENPCDGCGISCEFDDDGKCIERGVKYDEDASTR